VQSNWALFGVTTIYSIATIAICVFNHRSAKAIKEQVQEQKRQFDATNRPNVDVTFEVIRNGLICLKVENTGEKFAQDVKLTFNDNSIKTLQRLRLKNIIDFNNSTFNLGIGQKWFAVICGLQEFVHNKDILLEIDISYKYNIEIYKGHTTIDFSQYDWAVLYDSPLGDTSEHIRKISNNIEKCSNAMKNIEQLIQKDNV
jgi:hypothetical protein